MTSKSQPQSSTLATKALDAARVDQDWLLEQLKEAYPSASDRLLAQAIAECQKEVNDPGDRERLIRCVRERITA